jgi:AcrR family transcriptional regulator
VSEPRRRSPRGQGAALRGDLLHAAMDLLSETGSEEAVSMRAVATRAGVSVPSVYLHFADKQALLDAVCDEVFEALHVAMKGASEDAPHVFEALRRQGVAYVEFALANPEHYRIVMMRAHPRADAGVATDMEIAGGAFGHLVATVEACVAAGVFEGEPLHMAVRLWAAAHGIAALLVAKPYFPWPPIDELVDSTIRMAGLGLVLESRIGDLRDRSLDDVVAHVGQLSPAPAPRRRRPGPARR